MNWRAHFIEKVALEGNFVITNFAVPIEIKYFRERKEETELDVFFTMTFDAPLGSTFLTRIETFMKKSLTEKAKKIRIDDWGALQYPYPDFYRGWLFLVMHKKENVYQFSFECGVSAPVEFVEFLIELCTFLDEKCANCSSAVKWREISEPFNYFCSAKCQKKFYK